MTPAELGQRYRELYLERAKIDEKLTRLKEEAINKYASNPNIAFTGIVVKQTKPRKTTSWKAVAEELHPSNEIIEKHTKVGQPGYTIVVSAPMEEMEPAAEPKKFI